MFEVVLKQNEIKSMNYNNEVSKFLGQTVSQTYLQCHEQGGPLQYATLGGVATFYQRRTTDILQLYS